MAGPTVLVAGGTRGIGRAIGLAWARRGARVVLTHRWGSADADALQDELSAAGATEARVVEADISEPDDTGRLLDATGPVDVFVPNVCVAGRGDGSFSARTLRRSLEYSAWPLTNYLKRMEEAFGRLPRYVVATSSDGPDHFYPGYDYVAASKAVLEALVRRVARDRPDLRINALRARQVDTESYRDMFGEDARDMIGRFSDFDLVPEEVATVAVALCSGCLDGLSGATVVVDRGATPFDNLLNVAPRLMGHEAPWESHGHDLGSGVRPEGILWVDAGVGPGSLTALPGLVRCTPDEVGALPDEEIPASVVLGCDWRGRGDDDATSLAGLLPDLLQRAEGGMGPVARAVRVDREGSEPTPGSALADVLARYWGGWRVQSPLAMNAVRFAEDRLHESAVQAVRAFLEGTMPGVRGQTLHVTREILG